MLCLVSFEEAHRQTDLPETLLFQPKTNFVHIFFTVTITFYENAIFDGLD